MPDTKTSKVLEEASIAASVAAEEIKQAETRAEIAESRAKEAETRVEIEQQITRDIIEDTRIDTIEKDVRTWQGHLETFQASASAGMTALQTSMTTILGQLSSILSRLEAMENSLSLIPRHSEPKPDPIPEAIQSENLSERSADQSPEAGAPKPPLRKKLRI
jgi:hypothetical protein